MDLNKLLSSSDPLTIYYSFVAGGVKLKLLVSIIDSKLLDLYKHTPENAESYIISTLGLDPLRAKKWLHLLADEKFLEKIEKNNEYYYKLGMLGNAIFHDDSKIQSLCNHVLFLWKLVANNDVLAALRGGEPAYNYRWPPQSPEQASNFELWMTHTSYQPIYAIESNLDIPNIKNMLDVGGGDGTIACTIARLNPQAQITVYNLPHSAKLAKKKIASLKYENQVTVYEGDFLKENSFPTGFDYILFCRVLWDWSLSTNKKLLTMAYDALPSGGHVVICEAFRETYPDFALGGEFRYIFWNEVEIGVFKTSDEYITLLTEIGFKEITLHINEKVSTYSVILAQKP